MKSLKTKESESYPCVFTDSYEKRRDIEKHKIRNKIEVQKQQETREKKL